MLYSGLWKSRSALEFYGDQPAEAEVDAGAMMAPLHACSAFCEPKMDDGTLDVKGARPLATLRMRDALQGCLALWRNSDGSIHFGGPLLSL